MAYRNLLAGAPITVYFESRRKLQSMESKQQDSQATPAPSQGSSDTSLTSTQRAPLDSAASDMFEASTSSGQS